MGANLKVIKDRILKYADKESVFLEIAPGSGDLAFSLVPDSKHFYTIDPSSVSNEVKKLPNLTHIQGFFNYEILQKHKKHPISFIIFRHLLEHIPTPRVFLEDVVDILENYGKIYIEVPNTLEVFENSRFYEIFNDHCGYYQKESLVKCLESLGCRLVDEIFLYNNQHMGLIFEKNHISFYNSTLQNKINSQIKELNTIAKNYQNIAIYGAGAHGNTIITFLDSNILSKVSICFDLDSRKSGKFLQDSNIRITTPTKEHLNSLDCIIIAAPLYECEILESLKKLGFHKDIILTARKIKKA
ncbi:MAG: class I SAM-dependent methyltransferase [Helicobacteraceae bacterium]|nr:class I SAM-dependent methyltransferase [Helicobacteraceae bacterium]